MRKVHLFAEDFGHESFISALIKAVSHSMDECVEVESLSVRGGHGTVISEFKQYLRDLERGARKMPSFLVVATDANCQKYSQRERQIIEASEKFSHLVVPAVADPHIERWLLVDSPAFKQALGKGCQPPDQKCGHRRYKQLLIQAVREAGVTPLLGGMEHAEEIANNLDLTRAQHIDKSLGTFVKNLRSKFTEIKRTEHGQS